MAQSSFDAAVADMEGAQEETYKEATLLLQLLRDNLSLWTADVVAPRGGYAPIDLLAGTGRGQGGEGEEGGGEGGEKEADEGGSRIRKEAEEGGSKEGKPKQQQPRGRSSGR
eukprot:GHVT01049905.1.p2 GENE.GHVT01049905.1~~GHVT01049905.1.p2  ORF type:complete len:112 (+),score=43.24 GHVT01049905.1:514-849(+)